MSSDPALDLPPGGAELLESEGIGWLTTVHDGQPQSSPVWFVYADGALWLRSQPHQGKVRNIDASPQVSFHLDQRDQHVVTMEGAASRAEAFPDHVHTAYLRKYEQQITAGLGTTVEAMEQDFSVCLTIRPTRVRGW